jgi:hypothetical protein
MERHARAAWPSEGPNALAVPPLRPAAVHEAVGPRTALEAALEPLEALEAVRVLGPQGPTTARTRGSRRLEDLSLGLPAGT